MSESTRCDDVWWCTRTHRIDDWETLIENGSPMREHVDERPGCYLHQRETIDENGSSFGEPMIAIDQRFEEQTHSLEFRKFARDVLELCDELDAAMAARA